MKTSLKENLKNYITSYKPREEIRAFGNSLNRDSSTSDRKLRELTNEGIIKPIFKGKYIIGYEPVALINAHKPHAERTDWKIGKVKQACIKLKEYEQKHNETVKPLYVTKEEQRAIEEAESKQGVLI